MHYEFYNPVILQLTSYQTSKLDILIIEKSIYDKCLRSLQNPLNKWLLKLVSVIAIHKKRRNVIVRIESALCRAVSAQPPYFFASALFFCLLLPLLEPFSLLLFPSQKSQAIILLFRSISPDKFSSVFFSHFSSVNMTRCNTLRLLKQFLLLKFLSAG